MNAVATPESLDRWPTFSARQVAPGVHWLQIADGPWKTAFGAHVTVIGASDEVVIVDSAFADPHPYGFILGYLAAMGSPRVAAILLTHHHRDHSGGAERLRAATGAPIRCHPLEIPLVTEATARSATADTRELPGLVVDGALHDGETLSVAGIDVVPVHTPGHSPGHLCFFLPQRGVMLTGDTVLGNATTSVSPPHGDMGDLIASLERLATFPMSLIVPSHGPLITDPAANVRAVLAHRKQRETQVLALLDRAPANPTTLASQIYVDVDETLLTLAERQVASMLRKLERDGAVVSEGEGENRLWRRRSIN